MIEKYIKLPADCVAGQFQRALADNRDILKEHNTIVILDLSEVTFLEVTCQILLLIAIDKRLRERKDTLLNLPKSRKVRDMLRVWRFPDAIKQVSGYGFFDLVTEKSKQYFGEENRKRIQNITANSTIGDANNWLPANVLTLTTFIKNLDNGVALRVADNWKQRNIDRVFDRLFKGSNLKFSKNIVYESIVNSIRHPGASTIVIASSLQVIKRDFNNSKTPNGYLTLVIWDNGDSIIETLHNGLLKNNSIRTWKDSNFSCVFHVKVKKDNSEHKTFKLEYDFEPSIDDPDYKLLVSSFLPGISSNPEKENELHHPERSSEPLSISQPGMGLYLLANTVVHEFGGSVLVRTKNQYINIKNKKIKNNTDRKPHFDCKIEMNAGCDAYFGNMLTVRIPIRNDYSK